ncbi:O-antigen ligase family protein [Desulfosediminicola ganghwensis]|uniref:O-antigen ligase family protein n=1 Tax=Desulfosediminicola ganghwensis TaxID=2569540 RepID=UPI0010AB73FF|nr:O-antigen ligase family protein [Desulfosediminicola ganghwensis]
MYWSLDFKIRALLIATVTITPLLIWPNAIGRVYTSLPKVYAMVVFVICFLLIILAHRKEVTSILATDRVNFLLLFYFILLLISVQFAGHIGHAMYGRPGREEGLTTIMLYMLLFLAGRSCTIKADVIFRLMLISALIISIHAILQFFGLDQCLYFLNSRNWQKAYSTMGNPNFLSSYLVLLLPLCIHLFVTEKRGLTKHFFPAICYSILFYCLLCTRTRGAWLGAIAAIISYPFLLHKYLEYSSKHRNRGIFLAVLTFLLATSFNIQTDGLLTKEFLSLFTDAVATAAHGFDAESAGSSRIFIWKRVIALISMKPWFGHGIENLHLIFAHHYDQDIIAKFGRKIWFDKAHNEYLHIAVCSGIPSLIVYILFIYSVIRTGFKRLNTGPNKVILVPIMASIIGYLIQAFFNISVVMVAYIFWIFLGILAGTKNESLLLK